MKEVICGIYKITSPTEKVYIGQSIDAERRIYRYKVLSCSKKQPLLHRSLCKYGWHSHQFEIIHTCEPNELNYWEKIYVNQFNSFNNQIGLNLKDGGDRGGKLSLESIQKIKTNLIGKYIGEKNPFFGKKHSEATKIKMRKPKSEIGKQNMRNGWAKRLEGYVRKRQKYIKTNLSQEQINFKIREGIVKRKIGKTSKYIGVNGWGKTAKIINGEKIYNHWVAKIRIGHKKRIDIGVYKNEVDAAIAYNVAAEKYHGEFANLNVID